MLGTGRKPASRQRAVECAFLFFDGADSRQLLRKRTFERHAPSLDALAELRPFRLRHVLHLLDDGGQRTVTPEISDAHLFQSRRIGCGGHLTQRLRLLRIQFCKCHKPFAFHQKM